MADPVSFKLDLTMMKESIVVGGQDLTRNVRSLTVIKESVSHLPILVLELMGDGIQIEGAGQVLMQNDADVMARLDEIDPSELEAEAIRRAPMGASVTEATLQIIREQLSGDQH